MSNHKSVAAADVATNASRRSFLATGLAAPFVLAASGTAVAGQADLPAPGDRPEPVGRIVETPADLIVETDKGKIRGYVSSGIQIFKGVPYGEPTGGKNRFMPPLPREPWSGVRDALSYGAICPQKQPGAGGRSAFLLNPVEGYQDEDCLNLNIWTPGADSEKRPVMVWIHGGNYSTGSSFAIAAQDGEALANRGDVVVVSVNHRLNVLGHLDLQALGAPDAYASSVNVGILDLISSLEWVRDNIAQFGGNPENVTVFGQSGGGLKITHLSGAPGAKGLFHKAIVQSGSQVDVFDQSMTKGLAELLLEELGQERLDIEYLQNLPVAELQKAAQNASAKWSSTAAPGDIWQLVGWAPRIESGSLPWHPYSEQGGDVSRDITLMAGSTLHEFNMAIFAPIMEDMSESELISNLSGMYSEPEAILAEAKRVYPGQKPVALSSIISAASFNRRNVVQQCQSKAALGGAPAYLYQYAWETPVLDGTPRAYHCAELPMVFASASKEAQATGGAADALYIESQVCDAWLAFARSGSPDHSGLPTWPAVNEANAPTLIFDTVPNVADGKDKKLTELIQKYRI